MGYCPHSAHLAITRPGNNRAVAGLVAANGLKKRADCVCPYGIPLSKWAALWLTPAHCLVGVGFVHGRPATCWADIRRPDQGGRGSMNAQELLREISDYCRQTGLAESTFGRRAVNDGKLANRLRNGGRITTETLDRIRAFMQANRTLARPAVLEPFGLPRSAPKAISMPSAMQPAITRGVAPASTPSENPQRNFRFFDNRQKYLLFVNTCSEKWVVAHRVSLELASIHPRPDRKSTRLNSSHPSISYAVFCL